MRLLPRDYLTEAEAAEALGVSSETLQSWVAAGDFPSQEVEGRVVVPLREFRQWHEELLGRMREGFSLITPARLIVRSFAGAIVAGTLLLWLPFAHHGNVGPLESLFTATSAVCVTGLIVVDTGSEFTVFGQLVILLMMFIGGSPGSCAGGIKTTSFVIWVCL